MMGWHDLFKDIIEIIKVLTPLAWPIIAIFAIVKFFPHLENILSRNEGKIEFGSFKLSYGEAADRINSQVKDLQDQVIKIEKIISGEIVSVETENSGQKEIDSKLYILWVDDYPSNNALLIDRFQKQNIDVSVAISTQDAMLKMDSYDFDLIITDLGRRENEVERPMAGLELIEAVRGKGESVPMLVFAGQRGLQNRERLLTAGATAVTSSPTQVVEFVDNIRSKKAA